MAMPMPMPSPPMWPMDPPPAAGMPGMDMGMPMHATFFWGHRAQVLFNGWPGDRRAGAGMYVLCLLVVLALAALVEALSAASKGISRRRPPGAGAMISGVAVHAAKMALAYVVMLAVMSFNVGVLIAAVAGHALGFLFARSGMLCRAAGGGGTGDDDAPRNGGAHAPSEAAEPKP